MNITETALNVTNIVTQQAGPTINQAPTWIQNIGHTISAFITQIVPGKEWLVVLGIAGLLSWFVVKKLREGLLSLTALWAGATIVIFLALKYIGL